MSVRQQCLAVIDEYLAQDLRAVGLQIAHEAAHRVLATFMMWKVAGIAVHILESVALDIGADRLEVEACNTQIAADIFRWLELEPGVGLRRWKRRGTIEAVHVLCERAYPVTSKFRTPKHKIGMSVEHATQHHRHQIVLDLQVNVGQRPWVEGKLRPKHPPLERGGIAPLRRGKQFLTDRNMTHHRALRRCQQSPERIHPRTGRGYAARGFVRGKHE